MEEESISAKTWNALYQEAKEIGAIPPKDPLEGFDVELRIAKALKRVGSRSS